MEQGIIDMAKTQGFFAVLFVALLFYVLRTNEQRENRYQEIIANLSCKLGIVEDIQADVREIKNRVYN